MVTYRDIILGLRSLNIDRARPIIVHTSLSAFGEVHGGSYTIIGALMDEFEKIVMPAFTYRTMITPITGPENNAINYGNDEFLNRSAKIYYPDMPVDRLIGNTAENFRQLAQTYRSSHPILSFCGSNMDAAIDSQTIENPFSPLEKLYEADGTVILMGVNHIANTSIHLAEIKTKRKTFVRWALTRQGVIECPGFPSCSGGFEKAAEPLDPITSYITIGKAKIRVLPIKQMVDKLVEIITQNPYAFLCGEDSCQRYQAVRVSLSQA